MLTIWWCPHVESSRVVGRGCLLWQVRSLGKTLRLCPASFCSPRPNLPVTPGISWLLLLHSSPLWWKGHLFWVLVLEGLVGLHRTVKLKFLQHYWSEHRLGLPWYWIFCLGNEQRTFCCFWDCIQVLHFWLLFDYDGCSISSKGFLPTVVWWINLRLRRQEYVKEKRQSLQ